VRDRRGRVPFYSFCLSAGEEAGILECFKAFKRALCLGRVGNRLPALPLTKQRWQRLVPGSSPCTAHGLLVVGGAATTSPPLRREDYCVTCAVIEAVLITCTERYYHTLLQIHLPSAATVHTRLPSHRFSACVATSHLCCYYSFFHPSPLFFRWTLAGSFLYKHSRAPP
jgi:hypothetical protein